jgi:predicted ATPase
VFILPPWPEIYVNDAERPQTLAETESLHDAIRAVYESLGYELIEVPKLPGRSEMRVCAWEFVRVKKTERQN